MSGQKENPPSGPPVNPAPTSKPFVCFITNAGKTACIGRFDFLEAAEKAFSPDHVIIVTSDDYAYQIAQRIEHERPNLSFDVVTLKNPYDGFEDYHETMAKLLDLTTMAYCHATAKDPDNPNFQVILNGSGGTSKFTYLLGDFSVISSLVYPTRLFFGIYRRERNAIVFTEKPQISKEILQKIVNLTVGNKEKQEPKETEKKGEEKQGEKTEAQSTEVHDNFKAPTS